MSCNIDPIGDAGWHTGMTHVAERQTPTHNKLTMQQFYDFRLAIRDSFTQSWKAVYAVDAYVKTEGCRLYFIRNNQRQLRVELDHLHNSHLCNQACQSSSPSHLAEVQDQCTKITKMPCNSWKVWKTRFVSNIVENLGSGERSEYRPNLVFKLHLSNLLKDIKDCHILGVPVAHVHVIEFQKRGLPHCHMLREQDKLRNRDGLFQPNSQIKLKTLNYTVWWSNAWSTVHVAQHLCAWKRAVVARASLKIFGRRQWRIWMVTLHTDGEGMAELCRLVTW